MDTYIGFTVHGVEFLQQSRQQPASYPTFILKYKQAPNPPVIIAISFCHLGKPRISLCTATEDLLRTTLSTSRAKAAPT
jgi:hypothetical protein